MLPFFVVQAHCTPSARAPSPGFPSTDVSPSAETSQEKRLSASVFIGRLDSFVLNKEAELSHLFQRFP